MPETFMEIVKEIGGGLVGVVIVALSFACWRFLSWFRESQNARITELKASIEAFNAQANSNERVAEALRELAREIRGI